MIENLIDSNGENQAVREFLKEFQCGLSTVESMKEHLRASGFPHWPDWVDNAHGSITKSGAQSWLRYLFELEYEDDWGKYSQPEI